MAILKRAQTPPVSVGVGGTIAVPGGVLSGDHMFMHIDLASSAIQEHSIPDGWQLIPNAFISPYLASVGTGIMVLHRLSPGSEPATYTTDFTATVTAAIYVVYSDIASPITLATTPARQNNTASTSQVWPTITMPSSGMLLNFGVFDSVFAGTPPGGSTEEYDSSVNGHRMYLLSGSVSSGATGTRTVTSTSQASKVVSIGLIEDTYVPFLGPQFRSSTVVGSTTTSASTSTISAPSNIQVGDLLYVQVEITSTDGTPTVTGYTSDGNYSGVPSIYIFHKTAVIGDIGANITINWPAAVSREYSAIAIALFSPGGYILLVDQITEKTNTASITVGWDAITTSQIFALVILSSSNSGTTTPTLQSSDLLFIRNAASLKAGLWLGLQVNQGSTGTFSATQGGNSSNSKAVTLSIIENITPDDPTSLVATGTGANQIGLTWNDASDNETGFEIERSPNGSSSWSLIHTTAADVTSYTNTGLSEYTIYYYRIRSVNAVSQSNYSSVASATTEIIAPSSLTATTISDTQINLAWTDNSGVESGYKVEQSSNGTTGWAVINTTAPNANSYSVTGLAQNTIKYFRVRAFVGSDFSPYSSVANATTFPSAATGLAAAAPLSTKIVLNWTDNASGETGWKVERSPTGAGSWSQIGTTAANATTYDDTTVSASTAYFYRIRPYTSSPAQNGAYSSTATATTPATLTTPTSFLVSVVSPTSVSLTWLSTNLAVSGFKIERKLGAGAYSEVGSASTSPYLDLGLTPEATYTWKIRAYRSGSFEYSSYSSEFSLTMPTEVEAVQPSHLFLLNPDVVFSAVVDMGTIAYPIDSIAYDGETGTYSEIRPGMTIAFGSAAGLSDQGRQRVRSLPGAGTIGIGRSSQGRHDGEITIANDSYVTILDEFKVWSKTPFITAAGVIYKDSDIAISDNTKKPPPVSNCGPGFAGTIDEITGLITVQFTSTSFATAAGATITNYLWSIDDGTLTAGSLTGSTATCTFPAGFRWVHLRVTDSNGKQHTSHCPVYARDPLADTSIRNFQITQHSIKQTGQNISFNIREDISVYPEGMLAMLWEGEAASPADRSMMAFIGYHHTNADNIAAQRTGILTDTTLNCVDVAGRLGQLSGYSQIIEHDSTPTKWTEFDSPNTDLYIHYLLHWHSTALDLADFQPSGTGSTYAFQILGSDETNLHEQVMEQCRKMIPDWTFTCNRRGQLAVKIDPMIQNAADRTATVQVTLYAFDYSDIQYTRQHWPTVSRIHSWAILTGTGLPLDIVRCYAPGVTFGQGVESREINEGLVPSQTVLNDATGRRYARMNTTLDKLRITLAYGDDRGIEPANMTWVNVDLPASIAAPRGMTLLPARGLVHEMNIRYDYQRTGTVKTIDLTWEVETTGYPGMTETVVATAPIDTGWTPPPAVDPLNPPHGIASGVENVALINNHVQIFRTADFQSSPPTWTEDNTLFFDTSIQNWGGRPMNSMIVDPFSPLYRSLGTTVRAFGANKTGIYRIDDIFAVDGDPVVTQLYTFAGQSYVVHRTIMASFGRYFSDESDNPWLMVASTYNSFHTTSTLTGDPDSVVIGDTTGYDGVKIVYSKDAGATWSSEIPVTGNIDFNFFSHGVTMRTGLYLSPKTPGLAYLAAFIDEDSAGHTAPSTAKGFYTTDWGETWAELTAPAIEPGNNLAGVIHVPYPTNDNEDQVLYGKMTRDTNFSYFTMRSNGASTTDISPTESGKTYGPWRFPFGIRTYDSDRSFVAMAGRANDTDNLPEDTQPNGLAAVFVSDDGGDTWTTIVAPMSADTNQSYPDSVAFSGDNPDVIYIWGNERYVAQSLNFGASVEDKQGNLSGLGSGGEETLLFAGGDS